MNTRKFLYCAIMFTRYIMVNEASRILGIFPVTSRSHFAIHQSLMKGLSSKGHHVTVLSFFNQSSSTTVNYRDIGLSGVEMYVDSITPDEGIKFYSGILRFLQFFLIDTSYETGLCEAVYTTEYVRRLLLNRSIRRPDVLIVESFYLSCFGWLAEKLDVPLIYTITTGANWFGPDFDIGNPIHPAYMPYVTNEYTQTMNFYQRLINWLHYATIYVVYNLRTITKTLDKTYAGNSDITTVRSNRRASLILINGHVTLSNRPLVPNAIYVGGIHVKDAKPLPSDIRQFIEEAKDGAIFFSFGTTIKIGGMTLEKLNALKKAFSTIPQRVLWRSDVVNLTDVPQNVMIKKWFPQRDILEHENVKAFISHGGISGVYEAIYSGTPIIGIPLLFDQYSNINILQEKGAAICLDYENVKYETLLTSLNNIITDPRYRDNMQKLSVLFKDHPMSPLDTAAYWIEYVIRHKGAPHLRSPSADMPFYTFILLDIFCFIVISYLIAVWIIYYCIKRIFFAYRSKKLPTIKKKSK